MERGGATTLLVLVKTHANMPSVRDIIRQSVNHNTRIAFFSSSSQPSFILESLFIFPLAQRNWNISLLYSHDVSSLLLYLFKSRAFSVKVDRRERALPNVP